MIAPKTPANERERLRSLKQYEIVDTLPEQEYDDLTTLAAGITGSPISLVSLVTESRQWFKSTYGISARETPREIAFCAHAINTPTEYFEVENALNDERFHDNPLVAGNPNIRFYGGIPLVDDGVALGTLCVIDDKPKKLSPEQIKLLKALSRQVISLLRLRKNNLIIQEDLKQKAFLYKILSHDLKGPIGSYATIIDMILADWPNNSSLENQNVNDTKGLLASIKRSSQQAYELVLSILEWTNNYDKGYSSVKKTIDIGQVINEVVDLQQQLADRKDIVLSNSCTGNIIYETDKNIVSTIIRNLIGNAIKYTKDNGIIRIECLQSPDKLVISVIDSGEGIEKSKLEALFDYDQLKISRGTSRELGYGLGLKVCKDLIEELGGDLKIESEVGVGTTAQIILYRS